MAPRLLRATVARSAALLFLAAACGRTPAPPAALPAPAVAADSTRASTVAAGVTHRTYWIGAGPWVIHALDVDRARCWTAAPLDAEPEGPSRELLTTMATRTRAAGSRLAGAVNADFFLFAPNGLPTGALVHDGGVVYGPGGRDVLAVDSSFRAHVTRFVVEGWLVAGRDSVRITRWNRPDSNAVAVIDKGYGIRVDSARLGVALPLRFTGPATPERVRSATWGRLASGREVRLTSGVAPAIGGGFANVPGDGLLVVAGRGTSDSVRALLADMARWGDTLRLRVAMRPFHPRWAVGGNGVLLRGGQVPARLDSVGSAGFRGRHPRTAVGFDRAGRRLLLVTVDGRQPGYSVGMTLRELAALMRALGADEALNLDGGGSTTFVVPDLQTADGVTIANRPSDKTERGVANGLAVVQGCAQ